MPSSSAVLNVARNRPGLRSVPTDARASTIGRRLAQARRFARRHPSLVVGAVLCSVLVAITALALLFAPYDPELIFPGSTLVAPSGGFLLGTDQIGRDLLSRIIYGGRASITVALSTTLLGLVLGTASGLIAGYFGGWTDDLIMRVMDILFAFPPLLLALAVVAALGPSVINLILAVGIVNTPRFARLVRALALSLRRREFVEAAITIGATHQRIIARHILPQTSAPLLVQTFLTFSFSFVIEASLSFLGLGVQPPTPSWGGMVGQGRQYMEFAPWVVLAPTGALLAALLSFNLLGDGIQDWLDPRTRK